MAKTLNYFEFKLTKPDGTISYSEATQHILPPLCYDYVKIEQINHYMNGSEEMFTIAERTPAEVTRWQERE